MTKESKKLHGKIFCLDHGHVELLDVMGDDRAIVDAARLSISGDGVKPTSEDRGLIRYLMRHQHWTPFEMVEFKFDMKLPIFVARQLVRHRTANINEMSARYSELPEEFYQPQLEHVAFQAKKNKQGRAEAVPEELARVIRAELWDQAKGSFETYRELLGKTRDNGERVFFSAEEMSTIQQGGGIARELARIGLPLSTYTRWVWKCDLRNVFNLLRLRLDEHAQFEIRVYADAVARCVEAAVPIAYEAFEDYILHAVTFSATEIRVLRTIMAGDGAGTIENTAEQFEWPTRRERDEFVEKFAKVFRGAKL